MWLHGPQDRATFAALGLTFRELDYTQQAAEMAQTRQDEARLAAAVAVPAGAFVVEIAGPDEVTSLTETVERFPLTVQLATAAVPGGAFAVDVPKIAMLTPAEALVPGVQRRHRATVRRRCGGSPPYR